VLCNAHLLRELQAVVDTIGYQPVDGADPTVPGWCWADQAATALVELKKLVDASLAVDGTASPTSPPSLDSPRETHGYPNTPSHNGGPPDRRRCAA
jgi:dienelactone hydrolase